MRLWRTLSGSSWIIPGCSLSRSMCTCGRGKYEAPKPPHNGACRRHRSLCSAASSSLQRPQAPRRGEGVNSVRGMGAMRGCTARLRLLPLLLRLVRVGDERVEVGLPRARNLRSSSNRVGERESLRSNTADIGRYRRWCGYGVLCCAVRGTVGRLAPVALPAAAGIRPRRASFPRSHSGKERGRRGKGPPSVAPVKPSRVFCPAAVALDASAGRLRSAFFPLPP